MKQKLAVILALVRKDVLGLLPLVLLSLVTFIVVPVVANLDLAAINGDQDFWRFLQANIYWLGFALGTLLMISVIQQDPADSLHHDWLTRPIARWQWVTGKLLFMLLTFFIPVLLSRVFINLSQGMSLELALSYAAGIESMEAAILVPLFLMAALLAPTLRKLIMLMVGVFFVFLLPGWSVTRPLLGFLGINLAEDYDSLMWVQAVLITVASLIGAGAVFWLLYCRRQMGLARLAFWSAVAVMFISVYPPQSLYNWERAIAVHKVLINDADSVALEEQVILDQAMACFPAALVGNPNATEEENQVLAQAAWLSEATAAHEPGSITFATPVRYRQILTEWFEPTDGSREHSVEWRLDRIRTRARFAADSLPEDVALRSSGTALNRYNPIAPTETMYWSVPAATVTQLEQDPTAELIMDFDAVLLQPTAFELPVDGQRHDLQGLGSCKAELHSASNQIDVECLKRGIQPDLVSVQFIGMDSSRIDSYPRTRFTHDWVEALKRQRYEFTLPLPSLADNDSIMVIGYEARRMLHKQLVIPGVLGNSLDICPLPGQTDSDIAPASSWSDKSPHEVSYISVEPGVRLEVLDWRQDSSEAQVGSDAPTLMLLPGLGATAHSYDVIAPKLARDYNVVGVTRRGTGDSARPDRGYGIERLSRDVLRVMDSLGIDKAVMVGHSFGGEELSYLGANHADRVSGLVYLDAAYDRVTVNSGDWLRRFRAFDMQLPPEPPIRPSEAVSYAALARYAERTGRNANIPEGEIIASYDMTTGEVKHDLLYLDALMRGIQAPDYAHIKVPAVSLYAVPTSPSAMMEGWYDPDDQQLRATVAEMYRAERARKGAQIAQFESEVADGKAIVVDDADHWIFVSDEDAVLTAMRQFVEQLPADH